MTLDEAKALKVGDLVRYHDPLSLLETYEVVMEGWHKHDGGSLSTDCVTLQTIAIVSQGDYEDDPAYIGEAGWINEYNIEQFEKIA